MRTSLGPEAARKIAQLEALTVLRKPVELMTLFIYKIRTADVAMRDYVFGW